MDKIKWMVLPVVLILFASSVFAQDATTANNNAAAQAMMRARYGAPGSPMGANPLINKEKIEKIMQSFIEMGLIYKMVEQPTMVSTSDGIIVAYGNTLKKYDKDLNVVKEVDLDVDVDGMQALAAKFAKKYSSEFMDMMPGMPGAVPGASSAANKPDDQKEEAIKQEIDQMK
jgi:hypothetical protein